MSLGYLLRQEIFIDNMPIARASSPHHPRHHPKHRPSRRHRQVQRVARPQPQPLLVHEPRRRSVA